MSQLIEHSLSDRRVGVTNPFDGLVRVVCGFDGLVCVVCGVVISIGVHSLSDQRVGVMNFFDGLFRGVVVTIGVWSRRPKSRSFASFRPMRSFLCCS